MVQTKAECEQAALLLGLSDTTAVESQTIGIHGCIYASNDWLDWHSPDGSPLKSTLCGTSHRGYAYECICKVGLGKDNFGGRVINFNNLIYQLYKTKQ